MHKQPILGTGERERVPRRVGSVVRYVVSLGRSWQRVENDKNYKEGANYFLENMSKTWWATNRRRERKQMDDIDLTVKLKR